MFVKARRTPTGSASSLGSEGPAVPQSGSPDTSLPATSTTARTYYRNIDHADLVQASSEADGKWYAKATASNDVYYFLDPAGYADQATCQSAIETALSVPA